MLRKIMLRKPKTYECGDVNALKNVAVPKLEYQKSDYGSVLDKSKLSKDVIGFLQELKTKNRKLVKGNYDNFFKKVDDLRKKSKGADGFLNQSGALAEMLGLCEVYIQKGKDTDRVGKIKELKKIIKQANRDFIRDVLGSKTGTGGNRSIKALNKVTGGSNYKEVIITGGIKEEFERGGEQDRFFDNKDLQRVIIAKDVAKIPNKAFENCPNLESIVIEPRNTELVFEKECIINCSKLKQIKIKGGLVDCAKIKIEPGAISGKKCKSAVIPLK